MLTPLGIIGDDSASEDEEERQSPEEKPEEVSIYPAYALLVI